MRDWEPAQDAWDKFLNLLDEDPDKAGDKYEGMRRKLLTFFECRGCLAAERLSDISINRVIKRYFEGEVITSLMGYVYGVAKLVYLEYLSEQGHEQIVRDEFTRAGEGFVEPDFVDDDDSDDLHMCFNQCMAELPAADRAFIKRYYEESRRKKIDNRNSMVEQLKISKNAVVLRAFHIRQRLRKCINKCLKKRGQ